jgi:hypothetical protein
MGHGMKWNDLNFNDSKWTSNCFVPCKFHFNNNEIPNSDIILFQEKIKHDPKFGSNNYKKNVKFALLSLESLFRDKEYVNLYKDIDILLITSLLSDVRISYTNVLWDTINSKDLKSKLIELGCYNNDPPSFENKKTDYIGTMFVSNCGYFIIFKH